MSYGETLAGAPTFAAHCPSTSSRRFRGVGRGDPSWRTDFRSSLFKLSNVVPLGNVHKSYISAILVVEHR